MPPGVVPVRLWTGETPDPDQKAPTATFLAGVARKLDGNGIVEPVR